MSATDVGGGVDRDSADRRRTVLFELLECDPPVDLETIANAVLERERSEGTRRRSRIDRRRLVTLLHHVHLPALDHAGHLTYDASTARIVDSTVEADDVATTRIAQRATSARPFGHRHRRSVLAVLSRADGPVDFEELSSAVVSLASSGDRRSDRYRDPEEVRISLYHDHVPRLEEAGLVTVSNGSVDITGRE